jgi:two-component system OmpR family sensor kinase
VHSLRAKLSAVLLGLFLGVGAASLAVTLVTSRLHTQEVQQKLNRDLARHILADGIPMRDGEIDSDRLEEIFHLMMVINPSIEVYLLDPEGTILAYSAPPGKVRRKSVSLAPIRRFLTPDVRLPIRGDDPRDFGRRKVFSAAPIAPGDHLEGYLYVILAGEQYDSVAQMLRGSFILRTGSWAVGVAILAALLGGLLLFGRLTRRLTRLAGEMEEFERRELAPARKESMPSPPRRGDEIDSLAATFREMASRIAHQLDQLKENDRLRRELVANVSHDLRTPLTHLQGYLETLLLKEDALDVEERKEYLGVAVQQAQRLGRLVGDLFELAKLDALQAPLERECFSAAELVQDVVQKFRLTALKEGVELEARLGGDVALVWADLGLVERVLENLIENALRYTPAGGRVTVLLGQGEAGVAVEVRDTGRGIPASELPHIFDRFYRSGSGSEVSGAGLGLAIAQRAVQLHARELRCESVPGKGTAFRFELPPPAAS